MNLANKLTALRIALIPVFLVLLYWGFPGANYCALAVFIVASLTDLADGYIARHYNQITNIGKFMDPLADKMLVLSAMCIFIENGQMPAWAVAIVLLREFGVSGLRLIAVEQGKVIAAARAGKIKTACTMVCLGLMLVLPLVDLPFAETLNALCVAVILVTTVVSGIQYFVVNRAVFKQT